MSAEPHTFIFTSDTDLDGSTLFTKRLADFITPRQNGRVHTMHLVEAVGVFDNTFGGLFSDESVKRVGIASKFNNSLSVARVVPGDDPDAYRQELDLTPEIQYVTIYPGDKLAVHTQDGGRTSLTMVVNEMSEGDHIVYATNKPLSLHWRRYRIIRKAATGFQAGFNQEDAWRPSFIFRRTDHLLVAEEVNKGPIPLDSFCSYPEFAGCLVRVRFANISDEGSLHIVEPMTRSHRRIDKVANMEWTKVAWVSHDDQIALRSDPPLGGNEITICDLAIQRISAEQALQGRYDRGL